MRDFTRADPVLPMPLQGFPQASAQAAPVQRPRLALPFLALLSGPWEWPRAAGSRKGVRTDESSSPLPRASAELPWEASWEPLAGVVDGVPPEGGEPLGEPLQDVLASSQPPQASDPAVGAVDSELPQVSEPPVGAVDSEPLEGRLKEVLKSRDPTMVYATPARAGVGNLRQRLHAGETSYGVLLCTGSPVVAEIIGACG